MASAHAHCWALRAATVASVLVGAVVVAVNVAVTARAASIVTWQVVTVPEQAPDHDGKVDPFPAWEIEVSRYYTARTRLLFRRWWRSNPYDLAWMAVLVGGAELATLLMRG